jgi:hypothetical protein
MTTSFEKAKALYAVDPAAAVRAATAKLWDPAKVVQLVPATDEQICTVFGVTPEELEADRAKRHEPSGTVTVTSIDR